MSNSSLGKFIWKGAGLETGNPRPENVKRDYLWSKVQTHR